MKSIEIVTEGWRDKAVNTELKNIVLGELRNREKSGKRRVLALGFLATGAGAATFSALFLVAAPTMTLAQVIAAGSKVKSFTMTNRRIMGADKGGGFTIIKKVADDAVFTEVKQVMPGRPDGSFGYVDSSQTISYTGGEIKVAVIDGPRKFREDFREVPSISKLLKDFNASKVERDYDWSGRKVTRFTFKNKVHDYDIDQELLADPKTNLPLKFTSMRDNNSWGDEWVFDYAPFDKESIKPVIPRGARVIDLKPQRQDVVSILGTSRSDVPLFLTSPLYETVLIVKRVTPPEQQFLAYNLTIKSATSGKSISLNGYTDPIYNRDLKIGSQTYLQLNIRQNQDPYKATFSASDHLSGSLVFRFGKSQSKVIKFSNVRGKEVGSAHWLLGSFMAPMKPIKLGYQKP